MFTADIYTHTTEYVFDGILKGFLGVLRREPLNRYPAKPIVQCLLGNLLLKGFKTGLGRVSRETFWKRFSNGLMKVSRYSQ